MLDRAATELIKPLVTKLARLTLGLRLSADTLTLIGFGIGLIAAACIVFHQYWAGLALILLSRLFDALDGAVARLTKTTDRGGFLDICLDFLFYAAIPLAFALANPMLNALPAAVLLASFLGSGTSFLAFAALAAKQNLNATAASNKPNKSFYFLGGLTEATETLICFCAMCLWPQAFPLFAYGFATLCLITLLTRLYWGWTRL